MFQTENLFIKFRIQFDMFYLYFLIAIGTFKHLSFVNHTKWNLNSSYFLIISICVGRAIVVFNQLSKKTNL